MRAMFRRVRLLALGAALLAGAGCAGMGTMEDVLGGVAYPDRGRYGGEVQGEVRYVDTRGRRIQVRERDGRTLTAYYDGRTRVVYRDRRYSPSALERGDVVSMRVRRDDGRYLYTDYVYVRESVRDRGRYDDRRRDRDRYEDRWGRVERLEGRVVRVNRGRGYFDVRARNGQTVRVSVPGRSSRGVDDRLRRLRRGDYVRLDVRPLNRGRAELYRFRG